MKFALLSLITLLLASCGSPTVKTPIPTPTPTPAPAPPGVKKIQRVPYNPEEFARYLVRGTAEVTGQAFMKTQSGDVKYAAGNEVWLNPVTSMSNQWYKEIYLGTNHLYPKKELTVDDETLEKYGEAIIVTLGDGEGRFKFQNVPAGDYYMVTEVIWQVPGRYGLSKTGGWVCKKVRIRSGKSHNFILHR